ncbi:MAG: hypothetical protein U0175_36530 [Caldilineaceae bacterium]
MVNIIKRNVVERTVQVASDNVKLEGNLAIPADVRAVVVFVPGSDSSRFSPSTRYVADVLHENGFATLLFELLTPQEEESELQTRHLSSDVNFLARRILGACDWVAQQNQLRNLPFGYFGTNSGASAALLAAAQQQVQIGAVVARGEQSRLEPEVLANICAPTLFVVGASDTSAVENNQMVLEHLQCPKELAIVPGASTLFQEREALEALAQLSLKWFQTHLVTETFESTLFEIWQKVSLTHEQYRTLH